MKKIYSIIICFYLFDCSITFGQKFNLENLLKNFFLIEPAICNGEQNNISIDTYYKLFDFKITEIGECGEFYGKYYILDSFQVYNDKLINSNILKDSASYIVAIIDDRIFRLKGFSYNDFPFLLKYYLEEFEDFSVNFIIEDLDLCYNTDEKKYIDFECLYKAFRAKEINYDYYPCVESFSHSLNEYLLLDCWHGKNKKKKGGESFFYRKGKKL